MENDLRRWMRLLEVQSPRLIFRWVDSRAAFSYFKINAIKARTRHFLPARLSGEAHSRVVLGISFSEQPSMWKSNPTDLCFVIDRARLSNKAVDINGQSIYNLSGHVQAARDQVMTYTKVDYQREVAQVMADCQDDPNECFVFGDLRDLASCLVEIKTSNADAKVLSKLQAYCRDHHVRLSGAS